MSISGRIISLRDRKTRRLFAEELDISENTLRNYETGASLPNSDVIAAICQITNASPTWLILGKGPVYQKKDSVQKEENVAAKNENSIQSDWHQLSNIPFNQYILKTVIISSFIFFEKMDLDLSPAEIANNIIKMYIEIIKETSREEI